MRDKEQGSPPLGKMPFQPVHGVVVDMVRRFIENQQVAWANQCAGHGHPFFHASGEGTHIQVKPSNAKLREDGLDLAFQSPGLFQIHLMGQGDEPFLFPFITGNQTHVLQSFLIIPQQDHFRRISGKNLLQNRFSGFKFRFLRQEVDTGQG